jgi:Tol biopolymer transport system component/tRNA A-37 threonylcarbamoyl transferase component Bud32
MTGTTIAQYEILEKLGQGGMGVVYKARDAKLDRFVALKFLPPHLAASAADKARFAQEAKAAAALNHPNVCSILDIQEHDDRMFIVMEFVEGQTLRDSMGQLTPKQAIDIGVQVADGLAAAHEKGIIHRDVKPENIMVRKDGIAQIMDFGLAKLRASGSAVTRLTKEGSTVGTAGYMSPEQVQGQDADHRSDIFSLGVVLYEMFTRQLPFKGVHETALMYEIVNVDPAPMSAIVTDIDPELERIVLDCLQKDKTERAQSAGEVSRDLKRVRRESSRARASRITASRPAMAAAAGTAAHPATPAPKRSTLIPWIVAGIALLAAAALAYVHFTAAPPPPQPVLRASILPDLRTRVITTGALALSPDGLTLAYVAEDSIDTRLWVRPLRSSVPISFPGTEGAFVPFWSPDNRYIGFFAGGKLKKVEAGGGAVVTICDAPTATGGTWNADGVIVFTTFTQTGIYRVSAQGGIPAKVPGTSTPSEDIFFIAPSFLPDGDHFVFSSYNKPMVVAARTDDDAIFVGSLSSPERKLLVKGSSNAVAANGYLLYARSSTLVAQAFDPKTLTLSGDPAVVAEQVRYSERYAYSDFSVSANGVLVYQNRTAFLNGLLTVYDRSGAILRNLSPVSSLDDPQFSFDGKRLGYTVYEGGDRRGDVWVMDLARGAASRLTFTTAEEDDPLFSPDGQSIVFSLAGDLAMKPSTGVGEAEILYQSKSDKVPTDWSADGKFVVYGDFGGTTGRDIWVLPMTGDRKPVPFATTEFVEQGACFSPDGQWIAYCSNESGRLEIYIQSFPVGRGKWQVSTEGGTLPRWNRNGKELFFIGPSMELVAVPVTAASGTVQIGTPKTLFKTKLEETSGPGHRYDVSPDGLTFVMNDLQSTHLHAEPLSLISNWPAELARK